MIRPHLDRVNSSVERPWQGSLQTFEVAVRRCARQNRDSLDCQFVVVVVVDGFLPRFWLFFFFGGPTRHAISRNGRSATQTPLAAYSGFPPLLSLRETFSPRVLSRKLLFFFFCMCVSYADTA